ncbi:MAG: hypothetical protein J5620_02700 [Alphaproteobacteria bacterium]|nr:hypothetical protein [Alphaproteobacteria bacterium]
MVRKWEAMYYLRKFGGLSLVALFTMAPSLVSANTIVTSQTYVDIQDALDEKLSNKLNGTSTSGQKIGDLTAGSAAGQDQVMYPSAAAVKEYAVAKNQGVGTNNANVGKALVVGSSGVLELGNVSVDISGKQPVSTATSVGVAGGTWKNLADGTYTTVTTGANNVNIDVNATTDGTLANADSGETDFAKIPTAGAVKTYVNNALPTTMTGANGTNAGASGLVPAPAATDNTKFLNGAGQWAVPTDNNTTYTGSDGVTLTGTNFTNSGVRAVATGSTAGTVSVNTNGTSADVAVNGFANKQTKPSTGVANGKVLTYTGSDANANVSAAYVTVPVAAGAPSSNTPTAFAEIWVQ